MERDPQVVEVRLAVVQAVALMLWEGVCEAVMQALGVRDTEGQVVAVTHWLVLRLGERVALGEPEDVVVCGETTAMSERSSSVRCILLAAQRVFDGVLHCAKKQGATLVGV